MYVEVTLTCERTAEALDAWRLRTWQALRAGYEAIERKTAQDEQQQAYQRNLLGPDRLGTLDEPGQNAGVGNRWTPEVRLSHYFSQILYRDIKKMNGEIVRKFSKP